MSDDLEFIVIDDIPEYIFCIGDDEENEQVIAIRGKDGAFKYEKVAELPTTGEDGVLYLVPKSHTTQTASGNPINVNITDGAGKIESFQLDGDTTQYTYNGGNLFDSTIEQGAISSSDGTDATSTNRVRSSAASVAGYGGNITVSATTTASDKTLQFVPRYYDADGNYIGYGALSWQELPVTLTPNTARQIRLLFRFSDNSDIAPEQVTNVQITGATSAPNPDYPQQIQTVTGVQTISINGTDYPIDLGTTELCKIGDYQDYIYKDGEDWKVHKAIGVKIYTGESSEDWQYFSYGGYTLWRSTDVPANMQSSAITTDSFKSNNFTYWVNDGTSVSIGVTEGHFGFNGATTNINFKYASLEPTLSNWTTWLSTHNTSVYYPLATATDTTITDQTLIAQLEAVRTAALSTGSNTISNTATGTNLAGDLEIGYYGYDPLNKYDKYFWLDIDGGYESL